MTNKKKKSSCRPPKGSTYLTIGQDLFSIQEYVTEQYNASLHQGSTAPMTSFYPAAAMVYTDIQTLRGLDHPVDYGSGIEFGEGIVSTLLGNDAFKEMNVGLQIGLWLNGTAGCEDIVSGALSNKVDELVHYMSKVTKASKIFLRVGYEFDNPDFHYDDPDAYKEAFKHIVKECKKHDGCKERVEFVWHSWAAKGNNGPLQDYYPGDKYVDWVGVSIFDQYFDWNPRGAEREDIVDVLEFARAHDKPTMICESTPFGGIDLPAPYNATNSAWDRWFQPTLDLIEEYDIGMWSYINCDWESQPMWHNVGFGETRLSTNQDVMRKWQEQVLHNDRFLMKLECDDDHYSSLEMLRLTAVQKPDSTPNNFQEWRFGSTWFVLLIASVCSLYMWRHRDDYDRRQRQEAQRETVSLIRMIRYGSTESLE